MMKLASVFEQKTGRRARTDSVQRFRETGKTAGIS